MSTRRRPSAAFVAGLDALIIVTTAVALVVALGGDIRTRAAGFVLSVSGAWRPLVIAAVLLFVRWRWAGGVPVLGVPVSPAAHPAPIPGWSERPWTPAHVAPIALALAAAALWPLRGMLADLGRVPDLEDPLFSAWRVGWFAHQVVRDPAHLFDANIFHPAPLTLTYSDAHPLPSALAAPLVWAGVDALAATNLLFIAAFPLGALAYFAAAWRLTGDVRAAAIAGLLGGWYPFRFEHISHLELQWFLWIPLAILAAHAAIARGGWARGAVLGALVAAQALSSMYFGLMLAAYLVPLALCLLAGGGMRLGAPLMKSAAAAALVALVAALVLGPPYLGSRAARGDRGLGVVAEFSAAGRDYRIPNIHNATWGHRIGSDRKMERALFPGFTAVALGAAGMVPPLNVTAVALIVSGALAFDWSLGVNGLTYDELRDLLLPFRGLRAPARFSVLVGTSLILLGAFGAHRLFARVRSRMARHLLFAAIVVFAWIDLRPTFRLVPAWRTVPPVYAAVNPSMVLAEFPMRYDRNISYMYFSTTHWAKLVNGYSGFLPEAFDRLQQDVATFPAPDALARVRAQGATHLTVNCRFYGGDAACAPVLAALDTSQEVRLVSRGRWEGADVRLYEINDER